VFIPKQQSFGATANYLQQSSHTDIDINKHQNVEASKP